MDVKLRLSASCHRQLKAHLFPGDGFEAVALALCGRRRSRERHVLTVERFVPIPHTECIERTPVKVSWPTTRLRALLEEAARRDLGILKIHSHPGGYAQFSETDDVADRELFTSSAMWTDSAFPHASAVMLPGGRMFGRAGLADGQVQTLDSILVPGDDILFWPSEGTGYVPAFTGRHQQLFGEGTIRRLRSLAVAVVGCSGTGSPLIEQLARLGVGRLVLIDPDRVEVRNLNRILNATREDAYLKRPKVEVMARAIAAMGFDTELEIVAKDIAAPECVAAVAECDIVFGCMDSVDGRQLLNRLAAYYLLPYFDIGVKLEADGAGGVDEACGSVHYVKPDGATLMDRKLFDEALLRAVGLMKTDPAAYRDQVARGYIRGVPQDRPAVISINMQMAAMAINEFLARLHPYRLDPNEDSACLRESFVHGVTYRSAEPPASGTFLSKLGKGDVTPLLSMPQVGRLEVEA